MATAIKKEPQQAQTIRMSDDDIRTGMNFELAATKAQAHLQGILEAAESFHAQMRQKYNVPDTHQMSDWLAGFVAVQKE